MLSPRDGAPASAACGAATARSIASPHPAMRFLAQFGDGLCCARALLSDTVHLSAHFAKCLQLSYMLKVETGHDAMRISAPTSAVSSFNPKRKWQGINPKHSHVMELL